ncbi:MAG: Smr/MutS family protein [Thermodesulfobacteriota bacterium]
MKTKKSTLTYFPFEEIKAILQSKQIQLPEQKERGKVHPGEKLTPQQEEKLFFEAMKGVTPIPKDHRVERSPKIDVPPGFREKEEGEALSRLMHLIQHGVGFNLMDTPEYIEGTGYHIHPDIARRLHRGDFSIQAHIDLHGLKVEEAKEVFEEFLKWAVTHGKRGLLIIHGRGLSSPSEPVLKKKVVEWLTHGQWRKWVVAYSSARKCDGGLGATYVVLRGRPLTKRLRRRRKSPLDELNPPSS